MFMIEHILTRLSIVYQIFSMIELMLTKILKKLRFRKVLHNPETLGN